MGAAAYARGSQAIRISIDQDAKKHQTRDIHTDNRVDSLMETVTAQAREIDRQAKLLRRRTSLARTLLAEVRFLRNDARGWRKAALKHDRRWQYVSRILRALCTPAQVAEWRRDHDDNG